MTQAQRVKKHLEDYGCITSWEAVKDYGIMQLPARIKELEKGGMVIPRRIIKTKNRYGDHIHYTQYMRERGATV